MLVGQIPSALDIPTGLGKTAVIAIWLVARSVGAKVPRRLVYVVDRRAVVDQASEVAADLREFVERVADMKAALELDPVAALPISTLRGQFLDNREWLEDPSSLAIVVGTVDMVGSRLLFAGYGVSARMRPYHAGLLGADSLIVLDEAHLVPPFEHMLRTVEHAFEHGLGAGDVAAVEQVPRLQLLTLSATGRSDGSALSLGDADRDHPTVAQRLCAAKQVSVREEVPEQELASRLVAEASALTSGGTKPVRCAIFCNRRAHAETIAAALAKLVGAGNVELVVGARRVHERTRVANWLNAHGYFAKHKPPLEKTAFVVATSAGEVGVDLDAEHMVSDLVAWERMVQRLGRVNRRGEGAAEVIIVPAVGEDDDDTAVVLRAAVRGALEALSRTSRGSIDASPGSIVDLKIRASSDPTLRELIARASTQEPLRPALTRAHVEAWSMTSIADEDHPGRPKVEPWLRGWEVNDVPQTTVVWRDVLPLSKSGRILNGSELGEFVTAAGPELAEKLETETYNVLKWLAHRLEVVVARDRESTEPRNPSGDEAVRPRLDHDDVAAVIVDGVRGPWTISARDLSNKDKRKDIEFRLANATLMVDTRIGGLTSGLLSEDSDDAQDLTSLPVEDGRPVIPLRVRRVRRSDGSPSDVAVWREEGRLIIDSSDGEPEEWLSLESHVSVPARTENGRSVTPKHEQTLVEHQNWAEAAAIRIAKRLKLQKRFADMLALAAVLHDEGKKARRWQRAFRVPGDVPYAKTRSRPNLQLLAGYRHELGSLPYAERDPRVSALDGDLRDLCLHLIASHHGHARPSLRTDGAEEPPSKLEARAQEIALRFVRLEKKWGPWGLAWWESLLRAADQQASRANDQQPFTASNREGGSRG
ncbi:MAG: type I-U CRISPR-associated helicase/endonuclease Cas3 [Myxococcota bacterium]|nr:type I-U CRISPR-associated helicase/endonuclease Cas3 [Myxococcota bacterium]